MGCCKDKKEKSKSGCCNGSSSKKDDNCCDEHDHDKE